MKTIELTKADFLKKVANYETTPNEWKYLGDKPAIVDFYASWYSYNDTKLGQGRDAAKQCIADNPELSEELENLIFDELKKEK